MSHYLFLVSRHETGLYEDLLERFKGDTKVEVVVDRRRGERRNQQGREPSEERRRADRRKDDAIVSELRMRSHAIVTLHDPDGSRGAKR